ncbi:polyprenol monophosphomannose synthase [Pseudolysinimonas sp.]|jgi:dolichol-phosphate mannosyltransferase|uniref:polyprenol monophosphomannose synthase n=1 Tax=Pseudolysinimonas sp. TaxID=2680009 RepID=UPI003783B05F
MSPIGGQGRALVVIPTYNEIDSLPVTLGRLSSASPDVDVLVVDDASPDGTGALADRLAAVDPRIHVLHRTTKDGLGRAYLAGFRWGLERGHDVVVEMDADGSHPPESLAGMLRLLDAAPGTGLVIGSRWIAGGRVVDWPASRRLLSRTANAYARASLGIPVHDMTAGYRVYRAGVLAPIVAAGDVDSRGYCFQIDMTIRTHDAGWRIVESPIDFRDRQAGVSKMSAGIVVEAMMRLTAWAVQRRFGRRRVNPATP